MWELEYNEEVKQYFFDNDPYAFALLVRIEELKFAPEAIPPEGCTPLDDEPDVFLWVVLEHLVLYQKIAEKKLLRILMVKPLDEDEV